MRELESADAQDRVDGTPQAQRLRQIPPETGRFLALLAACAPAETHLEVGTSGGYSGLWLAIACRAKGARLVTLEVQASKVARARRTFQKAGLEDIAQVVEGDARNHLAKYERVAFCFLDTEKDLYQDCYDLVLPNLVPGGLLVADNATSHAQLLAPFLEGALADRRVDALVAPVGKGLLICRRA
jgi:predicted O-methyltransferase YrrM